MSVAGISSSNLFNYNALSANNKIQQFRQEFQQLGHGPAIRESVGSASRLCHLAAVPAAGQCVFVHGEQQSNRPGLQAAFAGPAVWGRFVRAAGLREGSTGLAEAGCGKPRSPSSPWWWRRRWRKCNQSVAAAIGSGVAVGQSLGGPAVLQRIAARLFAIFSEQRTVSGTCTIQRQHGLSKRRSLVPEIDLVKLTAGCRHIAPFAMPACRHWNMDQLRSNCHSRPGCEEDPLIRNKRE